MRSIPEAIVKQRNFDGRGHRHNPEDHYENDETQKDGYVLEDDEVEWEERQKRRRREREERHGTNMDGTRSPDRPSEQEEHSYPPILQDIPSTDEEDGIVGGLTKEDRKFLRARKKQKKKEKEKEDEHRRQEETSSRRKKSPRRQISSFPIASQPQPPTASRVLRRSSEENDSEVNLTLS